MPRFFRLGLKKKQGLMGYVFVFPFALGFGLFFISPFVQAIIFSLNELRITETGFDLKFVGMQNFYHALFVDAVFRRALVEVTLQMFADIPLILIFSFFAANLLNQRFKGRMFARVIFFLPVIFAAEAVLMVTGADYMQQVANPAAREVFNVIRFGDFLMDLRLPERFVGYILHAINHLPTIIRSSGIQILIFLAALQSIPRSLYEAADIEGATGWENFWMITFPMITPLFLVNIIFTIINFFTTPANPLVGLIRSAAWGGAGYGVSVAMAWLYFSIIAVMMGVAYLITRKMVYYET